ncbi:hypothetical protein [Sulfitobacter sp. R18_1]|uniref:hypothetical protein n=1 Tax=Sulfitobacter sp. R18_1 TaxID=2821104 RepID=UPI001ADB926B|nr:hypothetical protein [Sulfitobacter sp. R18_1]MBO9428051.1 hypothetical protein [Sulfitobacter sp. R18_1]
MPISPKHTYHKPTTTVEITEEMIDFLTKEFPDFKPEPKVDDLKEAVSNQSADLLATLSNFVKPLEWHEIWANGEFHISGPYSIYHGRKKCTLTYVSGETEEDIPCEGNLEDAKAAAQKHHVAQIMSALDVSGKAVVPIQQTLKDILLPMRWADQGGHPHYRGDGKWDFSSTTVVVNADQLNILFEAAGVTPEIIEPLGSCASCIHSKDDRGQGYVGSCLSCKGPIMSNFEAFAEGTGA